MTLPATEADTATIAGRMRGVERAFVLAALLWLPLAVANGAQPNPEPRPAPQAMEAVLRATLDRQLTAINARDLDALMATVTRGDALTLILPDGSVLETRDAFRSLHVDWFKDTGWRMVFDVEDVRVHGDVGIARVRYDSQVRGDDGAYNSRRIARLTLVFAREDGDWRLVYDQNTIVVPAAAE